MKPSFQKINNQVELKALITWEKGVSHFKINRGSQFITNQVKGKYQTMKDSLNKKLKKFKLIMHKFREN